MLTSSSLPGLASASCCTIRSWTNLTRNAAEDSEKFVGKNTIRASVVTMKVRCTIGRFPPGGHGIACYHDAPGSAGPTRRDDPLEVR